MFTQLEFDQSYINIYREEFKALFLVYATKYVNDQDSLIQGSPEKRKRNDNDETGNSFLLTFSKQLCQTFIQSAKAF